MYNDSPALQQLGALGAQVGIQPISLIDGYKTQLQAAKANVARIEEILSLLERNPDTQRMLELMGTARY